MRPAECPLVELLAAAARLGVCRCPDGRTHQARVGARAVWGCPPPCRPRPAAGWVWAGVALAVLAVRRLRGKG